MDGFNVAMLQHMLQQMQAHAPVCEPAFSGPARASTLVVRHDG
jgi:hypothetical protein